MAGGLKKTFEVLRETENEAVVQVLIPALDSPTPSVPEEALRALLARRSLAVGTIVLTIGLPQPAVSKHLGVLREAGIVSVSKQGRQRVYALNHEPLRPVSDWLKTLEQHWQGQLDRIRLKAERRALAQAATATQATGKKGTS